MYNIIIKDKFEAAHYLPDYPGDCARLHGHSWHIEVELRFDQMDNNGMCMDFAEAKKQIRMFLPDHTLLNEKYSFIPTAENLARSLYHDLKCALPVHSVTIWESENAGAKYYEQ